MTLADCEALHSHSTLGIYWRNVGWFRAREGRRTSVRGNEGSLVETFERRLATGAGYGARSQPRSASVRFTRSASVRFTTPGVAGLGQSATVLRRPTK